MDNIKLKLNASGYTVELKPYITTLAYRKYQRALMKSAKVSTLDTKSVDMYLSDIIPAQEALLESILIAVYNEKGEALANPAEEVGKLPLSDGQLVYGHIEKMISESDAQTATQKKIG